MLDKIKESLGNIIGWIIGIGSVIGGIMALVIYKKNEKLDVYKAQIDTAKTQKQADLIDAQINEHKANQATSQKEIDELNKVQAQLEDKRKQIEAEQVNKTSDEVEDFWNKK